MGEFYKVGIIDDEQASARALIEELRKYPRFNVEGVAHDAETGRNMIMRIMPDLLFLDVELPEMYGMELLAEVKDDVKWSMRVVFYTAHDKYLINALRNSAFDFLLKPIDKKEFEVVISRFLLDYETKPSLFDKHDIVNIEKGSSFMVVLPTGEMKMIKSSDVGFFRYASERKLWEAVLVTEESVPLRRNVSAEFLCAYNKNFVQVNQSYIVNIDFLVMIHDSSCILCPPFDNNTEITISRKYKKNLMDHLCIF
ncbi:LytTR family DNA-binding domain-containing protein [uncultured Bacteroides sp.]|uniref:LytR/AlgR family response regulator transcription factor n=1 Tax=uncultured Bacteroides sp. TaxID=162156 RepID=UPI002625D60B|nr:LytTR family DNA-binding domain-containing protein [uncultured Bacteroides sp.]